MLSDPAPAFAFDEADHLIRLHLKLRLEDLGFTVVEDDDTLALFGSPPEEGRRVRLRAG